MKRLLVILAIIMLSFLCYACATEPESSSIAVYCLPSSLQEIKEDAFAGTPVEVLFLPNGFLHISDRAFEEAQFLTDVYIPGTTTYISDSAFSKNQSFIVHGIDHSYAKDWAERHGIIFVIDNVWCGDVEQKDERQNNEERETHQSVIEKQKTKLQPNSRNDYRTRCRRTQDCPELNPIDYRFP